MSSSTQWVQCWLWLPWPIAAWQPQPPLNKWFYTASQLWYTVEGYDMTNPVFGRFVVDTIRDQLATLLALGGFYTSPSAWLFGWCGGPFPTYSVERSIYFPLPIFNTLPTTQCLQINRFTSEPGRRGRGRSFLSPILESNTKNGYLTDIAESAYQIFAEFLMDTLTFTTAVITPCMPSYKNGTLLPIIKTTVNKRLACVRRRRNPQPYNNLGPSYSPGRSPI